jgi:hypothetical protein
MVSSPNPSPLFNDLYGVVAVATNDVWAVGRYQASPGAQTLIEHWDGGQWTVVPGANPGTYGNELHAVAAVAADDIWAVGHYRDASLVRTLTIHWDGSQWTHIPSPVTEAELTGVAAVGANDVWAVGFYDNGGSPRTLIQHWDGSTWTVVPSPNPAPDYNVLAAVAAVGANNVWAVGTSYTLFSPGQALILHWDGSSWTAVPDPHPGAYSNSLNGVAAVAANDVWAVGTFQSAVSAVQTLTLHWNGSQWAVVPSPNAGTGGNYLYGVAAGAANDVWAVGYAYGPASAYETLTLHWDAGQWAVIPSPNRAWRNVLYGVAAAGANNIWAAGSSYYIIRYDDRTLIERYHDPCVVTTPCPIQYSDVPPSNTFYPFIRCLACRGIVSGYADGTFRWGADVTRGQLSKILANAAGLNNAIPSTQQTFADVPGSNPFWLFVERLAITGAISGYTCGGVGEPCDPGNRPYFRWAANTTRGQIAKIDAIVANFNELIPPAQQTFADVPSSNTFWVFVERLAGRGILSGYGCGGPGEPCDPQQRPYFRWGLNANRGQTAKVAAQTFYPNCITPARR